MVGRAEATAGAAAEAPTAAVAVARLAAASREAVAAQTAGAPMEAGVEAARMEAGAAGARVVCAGTVALRVVAVAWRGDRREEEGARQAGARAVASVVGAEVGPMAARLAAL